MTGLIMKDLLNIKCQAKIYLAILAIWVGVTVINGSFEAFLGFMAMLAVMIPITLMSYDEKNNWTGYALTMPVRRRDIVLSKYIGTIGILTAIGVVLFIFGIFLGGGQYRLQIIIFFSISVILDSITLAVTFKWGVEKGRVVFAGAFMISAVIVFLMARGLLEGGVPFLTEVSLSLGAISALSLLAAAAAAVISVIISKKIFEGKDF